MTKARMFFRATRRIGSLSRQSVLRRLLVAAMAVAFLTVTIGHAGHHIDAVTSAMVESGAAEDSAPGDAGKTVVAIDHCFACSMTALAPAQPSEPGVAEGSDEPSRPVVALQAHTPASDIRPPIA